MWAEAGFAQEEQDGGPQAVEVAQAARIALEALYLFIEVPGDGVGDAVTRIREQAIPTLIQQIGCTTPRCERSRSVTTVFLETERLRLRRFTPEDVDNLLDLDSDAEVRRHLDMPAPPTRENAQQTLNRFLAWYDRPEPYGYWVLEEKNEAKPGGVFAGWFHFRPHRPVPQELELGYRLKQAYWGRGYATEMSRRLLQWGFEELKLERIVATTLQQNMASRRVMEKIGMTPESEYVYDDRLPAVKYGIHRADYMRQRQTTSND